MTDRTIIPRLLEQALAEWRKQETLKRGSTSLAQFAKYLGYSRPIVWLWISEDNDRYPSKATIEKIAPKLADLLGLEVYDQLNLPRPDPLLEFIISKVDQLTDEQRQSMTDLLEKYIVENEKKKSGNPKLSEASS